MRDSESATPARAPGRGFLLPTATELRFGPAAPAFLPLTSCALLIAWALGGVSLIFGALMIATFLTSLLYSRRNTRGIELRALRPELRSVGEEFLFELELRRDPKFGCARDLVFSTDSRGTRDPRPAGLLTALEGRKPTRTPLALKLTQRGRIRELQLSIESTYPFGLIRRVLRYDLPVDLLALPRLGSLGDLAKLAEGERERAKTRRHSRTDEEEFRSLAEWREGMSLRRIHWKASARRGRTLIRELDHQSRASVRVVLVTAEARGVTAHSRSFELAVSLCATLCEHYLRRGRDVRLGFAGQSLMSVVESHGRGGLFACLEALAEVISELGVDSVDLTQLVEESEARGEAVIAIFAGGRRPGELLRCPSPALQLDVDDPGIDAVFHRGRAFGASPPMSLADAS